MTICLATRAVSMVFCFSISAASMVFFFSTSVYPAIWAFWGTARFGWSEAMIGATLGTRMRSRGFGAGASSAASLIASG